MLGQLASLLVRPVNRILSVRGQPIEYYIIGRPYRVPFISRSRRWDKKSITINNQLQAAPYRKLQDGPKLTPLDVLKSQKERKRKKDREAEMKNVVSLGKKMLASIELVTRVEIACYAPSSM